MKKFNYLLVFGFLFWGFVALGQDYSIDTDATAMKWHAKKVTGEHYGDIKLTEGSFTIEDKKFAKGVFVIDMTSITCEDLTDETWNQKLVGHLKSDDFFSVEKFTAEKLLIKGSSAIMDGKASIKGELTIKGITHPIAFDVEIEDKTYKAKIVVDRTLYDVKYGSGKFFQDLGDNMIDDEFILKVKLVVN